MRHAKYWNGKKYVCGYCKGYGFINKLPLNMDEIKVLSERFPNKKMTISKEPCPNCYTNPLDQLTKQAEEKEK